ncbi:ROK family protein [Nocardioides sp. GCM10027113]|uniref:ROK family protein n=1 Tax=unclassified Nocardioides TaxID=2615069 RepID=UPI003609A5C9
MGVVIGVDVGGTKVLALVVDDRGQVLRRGRATTPGRLVDASLVEDALTAAVEEAAAGEAVDAVGVAAAGFVDAAGERVVFAPHLPWRGEPLRKRLTERWGTSVLLDNDANCAAHAEATYGAARGSRTSLLLTLGTGIGGALVVDGVVLRGANGMAGEFGHMQVVPDGLACECGRRGCWEQYSSGNALVRLAREGLAGAGPLLAASGGDPDRVTGPMVTEAAQAGDPVALAAFGEVGDWLGVGLADLVAAFDPDVAVVGGGVAAAGELLLAPARAALDRSLVGAGHRVTPPVVAARLGPEAGAIGAADLARRSLALRPHARWFRRAGTPAPARPRAARGRAPRR